MPISNIGLQEIHLDISTKLRQKTFYANEVDTEGRGLHAFLQDNGVKVDGTGVTMQFRYKSFNDGESKVYDFTPIGDPTNGEFEIHYPTEMVRGHGNKLFPCTIVANDLASELAFENVFVYVNKAEVNTEGIEASNEYSALQVAFSKVENLEMTYAPRLGGVESQLAENVNKFGVISEISNYKGILNNRKIIEMQDSDIKQKVSDMLDLGKMTTTTVPPITIFTATGSNAYNMLWHCDFSMTVDAFPEYFTAQQIKDVFEFVATRVNTTTYECPDHISSDGTVYWTPGMLNNIGERARLDVNCWLVHLLYQYYKKSNDITLYNQYKDLLKNVMDIGLPWNPINGLVSVPSDMVVACFGYNDSVRMTGDVFMMSCLAYMAYMELVIMSYDNSEDYTYYSNKCKLIKKSINETFWVELTNTNTIKHTVGLFKASTGLCSGQLDIWGSAFATYLDIADKGKQLAVANLLVDNYNGEYRDHIYYQGGIRQVPKTADYVWNTKVWESYISEPAYGTYQNGAYWTVPLPWVCYAISLIDKGLSYSLIQQAKENYILLDADSPYEWKSPTAVAGLKFINGGAMPLIPIENESASSGWIDITLLNGWVYQGEPQATPAYMKDKLGFVHLKGLIKNGITTGDRNIFYLPVGCRPSKGLNVSTISDNSFGAMSIGLDGRVIFQVGSTAWFSLDCITFKAEQ